jgi:hypothetical protein
MDSNVGCDTDLRVGKRPGERRRSDRHASFLVELSAAPASRTLKTLGADAADRWLTVLGLQAVPRWYIEIVLPGGDDTRLDLNVYAEEWGYVFQHAGRTSWIRVTDIAFVHGRDEHGLLATTPDLLDMHALIAKLEAAHGVRFARATAIVHSNVPGATERVRSWLENSGESGA